MKLTDEQLYTLLDCDVWTVSNMSTHKCDTTKELECLGLLVYEALTVIKKPLPSKTHIWKLTDLGHEVLTQNRVRALELLTGGNMVWAARKHFKKLAIEDLPPLLTHSNENVRYHAQRIMEKLLDGTN